MSKLTEKQTKMMEFIEKFHKQNNRTPSTREITESFGYTSINSVVRYLKTLEKFGYIQRTGNTSPKPGHGIKILKTLEKSPG